VPDLSTQNQNIKKSISKQKMEKKQALRGHYRIMTPKNKPNLFTNYLNTL